MPETMPATHDDAGLADVSASALRVFPRHLLPAKRSEIARRAAQIAWVTTKHFTPLAIRSARKREIDPDAFARPLRLTFEELGTTFMKFGQLVSSSPGVLRTTSSARVKALARKPESCARSR